MRRSGALCASCACTCFTERSLDPFLSGFNKSDIAATTSTRKNA
jgi:hypothetical protein